MIFRYFVCSICLVNLAACTVYPTYQKPNIQTPNTWQATLPHNGDINSLKDWWGQFNDGTLVSLIDAAQRENPTLDKAVANIQVARANQQSIIGRAYPTLDANGAFSKRKSGNAGGSGNIESSSIGLDAGWEIDLFGAVQFGRDAAQARVDVQQLNWHQARVSIAAEVATQYVQYRACESTVKALKTALSSQQETARITNISADAGFIAPADALLANASANRAQSSVIGQQAECDLSVKSLVALTGMAEQALRVALNEVSQMPTPSQFTIDSLPADLIRQRPDLMADERNLAAASADIGLATTDLYPSISLNGSIGYQKTVFNGFGIKTNTWSFGPSINLPIFDGGQRKAQVKLNEANFNLALATYKQDVRNAIQEVEQSLVRLDSASKQVDVEAVSQQQYADFFKAAELNWESGGLDLLALEDARRQMINAQTSLITQQKNRVLQWIALYKALGGDWQHSDSKQTLEKSTAAINTKVQHAK